MKHLGIWTGGVSCPPEFWAVGKLFEKILVWKFVEKGKIWSEEPSYWGNLGAKLKFQYQQSPLLEIWSCMLENCNFLPRLLFNSWRHCSQWQNMTMSSKNKKWY